MPGCLMVRVGGTWQPVASTVAAQWSDAYPTYDLRYASIASVNALPKGRMPGGYAQITAGVTLGTTQADVAGLSVTVNNMDTTRRYVVRAKVSAQTTVSGDVVRHQLVADGTTVDLAQTLGLLVAFFGPIYLEKAYDTGGMSGSHTFKIQSYRFSGTGTCTVPASTTYPMFIEVQDNGAA
jgi:hypothetical protein